MNNNCDSKKHEETNNDSKNNSNLLIPLIFLKYNVLGLLVGLPIYPSQIGQEVINGVGKKNFYTFFI